MEKLYSGDWLIEKRKAMGLSQEKFGRRLGISERTVRKFERLKEVPVKIGLAVEQLIKSHNEKAAQEAKEFLEKMKREGYIV